MQFFCNVTQCIFSVNHQNKHFHVYMSINGCNYTCTYVFQIHKTIFFHQFILSFKNMIKYYNQSLSSFICFSYCFKLAPRVCAWEYINDDVFPPAIRLNIPAVSLRQVSKSGSLEYFIRLSLDSNIPSTYPPKNEISK